jgi:beta-lactamase superfamily II metal-dependent hydrolase
MTREFTPMKNLPWLSTVAALLALAGIAQADQKTKTLDIYWLDSEGGGSTLIVTPANESVLIDSGNPGGRDPTRIIAAAKAAGLTKIDYFLLTHFHGDHFGGAAEIAQQVPFGTMFHRAIPEGDPDRKPQSTFQTQIKSFREITAKHLPLAPGVMIPLKSAAGAAALELRCIAADTKMIEPTAAQRRKENPLKSSEPAKPIPYSDNDNSAVFLLTFGGFRFFDGGDLTWVYEGRLVTPYNVVGTVDVYQTDHHGLDVSNNPVLIQSLAPTVVVMNNGPKKGGTPTAFDSIKSAKSVQARYQLHKSFNNVPDADQAPADCIANKENLIGPDAAKCGANLIKMSVAADGKSYTISVPATGHSHTYKTKG